MGLKNAVWHDHFFPSAWAWDDDRRDSLTGARRFDAVELDDGQCVVYSAEDDCVVALYNTREQACHEAQRLADIDILGLRPKAG